MMCGKKFTKVTGVLAVLASALVVTTSAQGAVIDFLDTWTGSGSTRTQIVDIDGISTIVTLTGASSVGAGNLTFNSDGTFGGWGVDTGPDGIHGTTADGALESLTISLAPVTGDAIYTFESVSLIGLGANAASSTTTMNIGSTTLDVGNGALGPGGSGAAVQTATFSQVTDSFFIDFSSTNDANEAGAFWRTASISAAAAVPEPSSFVLVLASVVGLAALRRRRR